MPDTSLVPEPTVFMLFGATGEAKARGELVPGALRRVGPELLEGAARAVLEVLV